MARNEHYIVLGAYPKADKGALGYFDKKAGMWAVKILQLDESKERDTGADFDPDEVEGEYVTIYFANQRGRDSLRMLRECLTELEKIWDGKEDDP